MAPSSVAPSFITITSSTMMMYQSSASAAMGSTKHLKGQGPYQQRLLHTCQQGTADVIPIVFIDYFPQQGNGWPGTNFGNQCGTGVYSAPGYDGVDNPANNQLLNDCPSIAPDIPICQITYGKKIVLSLGGGGSLNYQLTGEADGIFFADFLWGAYGPQNATWFAEGNSRPYDGPNGEEVKLDGFDFDIELYSDDNSVGCIAMINQLRTHFASDPSKQYLITGAPGCFAPDQSMGNMIAGAQFDILWIQYYNNAMCSARRFIDADIGFSYDTWTAILAGTASANAKLYIGLPGDPYSASTYSLTESYWLNQTEPAYLLSIYACRPNFGGVMMWDATSAENNILSNGLSYDQEIKNLLLVLEVCLGIAVAR
ncbi:glycoside hydrolase [Mollisia scopiformis]|uniref:chitinase n=1 Tax=Mollisia scopiformis TaxID=149040 RepID=A0A194X1F5_MOLSC|nr:glycoside hydrolase [Mollisia scopiformis]KUJ13809.1 glycoside hydrolase [Mollisia scopiformis]